MPKTTKVTEFQEVSTRHPACCHFHARIFNGFRSLDPNLFVLAHDREPVEQAKKETFKKVYALLIQIPPGRITTYGHLARALNTSPRAVGGALRNNPFAPRVPCHRVITSSGFIGGFFGECNQAPSGVNQTRKRSLLREEGVHFNDEGILTVRDGIVASDKQLQEVWFDGPWDTKAKMQRPGKDVAMNT